MRYLLALLAAILGAVPCSGQSPSFTYQGRLDAAGQPASGVYDLRFTLFNAAAGGAAVSVVTCANDVPVSNGLFTVIVPLTPPTSGVDSYLEVQVRPGASGTCAIDTGFTTLAPRQPLTPAPRAVFASAVPAQSPALRGAMRFNSASGQFEGFNGAYWVAFAMTGTPQEPGNVQDYATAGAFAFVVPPGIFSLGFDLWGSGGGGGGPGPGNVANECGDPDAPFSGGGGGGGGNSYLRATADVTPGETLTIQVGAAGAGGTINGGNGGVTQITRAGAIIARAFGGNAGSRGLQHDSVLNFAGPNCTSLIGSDSFSGVGGSRRGPVSFIGPGTIIRSVDANYASDGLRPRCRTSSGIPQNLCPAVGGGGAEVVPSEPPLPVVTAGAGGAGATPGGSAATAGQPGRIRLFWN